MKREGDIFILSSGQKVYANRGIIGLCEKEDGEPWSVTHGYDGGMTSFPDPWNDDPLTPAELTEIADYMIRLWSQFRQAVARQEP